MIKKLYYHKTDGGAEYLCTSPVDGTDEGDLYTAIIRLDGEPELLNASALIAPELYSLLKQVAEFEYSEALDLMDFFVELQNDARAAISKAEGS